MKHVQEALRTILLVALIASSVLSCLLMRDLRSYLTSTQKRTDAILTHVDMVAARAQRVMQKVEEASLRQREASDKAIQILGHLDSDVRQARETLIKFGALSDQLSVTVKNVGSSADNAVISIDDAAQATQFMVNDANELLKSPEVKEALKQLAQTSGQVTQIAVHANEASANLSVASGNVNLASKDVRDYIHRLTRPASAIKTFFLHLLGFSEGVVANTIP
jgi:hypothetical protein